MTPSTNCFDFIEKEESCVLHPYLDQAGIPTIGIGSTMYPDGRRVTMKDANITHEQARQFLKWEVDNKSKSVKAFLRNVTVTQNQFDALVSFAYNVGIGALQTSTLLKTILANPNESRTQIVEGMQDEKVREWMEKHGIRAVPLITYYFAVWCKITVINKQGHKIKILSEGLIKRRLREAALFHRS